jgi:hypothetical protein
MTPHQHLAKEQFLFRHPQPTELTVTCPSCKAPPDHACILRRSTPSGYPVHQGRQEAYLRAQARWYRELGRVVSEAVPRLS